MKLMKQKILVQLKLYPHNEVLKALRIVQNWGQTDGLPDCPQGMDTLVKLENILMLKKFQHVQMSVLNTYRSLARHLQLPAEQSVPK